VRSTTFNLAPPGIARALNSPSNSVKRHWPAIRAACIENGLADRESIVAVLATIGTEVGSFEPINEFGGPQYFTRHYENRPDLGNTHPGDGARYHGRGFIQLTGRGNYRKYGQKLGIPLEEQPEQALKPAVAARILGRYFRGARNRQEREEARLARGPLQGERRSQRLGALQLVRHQARAGARCPR
jgi:predicted chitinase